ncbi:MAG: hypothetical protein ACRD4O_07815 [Bryobacteraceae bacterium]
MRFDQGNTRLSVVGAPRLMILATAFFLVIGLAAALLWWRTGDMALVHVFFSYPGALFLIGCSFVQFWFSLQCWRNFSRGDLLRPAWLLITLSALSQLAGGILSQILAGGSHLNPLLLLPAAVRRAPIHAAGDYGALFSPLYMLFLALGLLYLLKACRQNGILGRFRAIDVLLFGIIAAYTAGFFATVVFAPHRGAPASTAHRILSWTSDPLLCILLFQAILIRRSIANMGWGLIARCWLCFTIAIFATSVGDMSLWAWSRGYLPEVLQVASWYIWFLASAAFALGPCYQLQAMLHATASSNENEMALSRL